MDLVPALRLEPKLARGMGQPPVISFTGGGGKTSTMYRLARELRTRGQRVVCTSTTRLAAYEVQATHGVVEVKGRALPRDAIAHALDAHGQCLLVTPEILEDGVHKYPGVASEMVDSLVDAAGALGIAAVIVEADGAKMLPLKAPDEHEPPLPASTTLLVPIAGMDAMGRPIGISSVHRPERVRAVLGLADQGPERLTPAHVARLLLDPAGGRKGLPATARFLPLLNKSENPPQRAGARVSARLMAERGVPSLVASTGCAECAPVHERWGPVVGIVMAAGESRRLGQPKQVLEVDGEPMVVRAVRTALDGGVTQVVVVTGAYASETVSALRDWMGKEANSIRIVHNPAWTTGQAGTLHTALRSCEDDAEAVLFLPVDQPELPSLLLRRLIRRWRSGYSIATPRVDGQVRGAPALFDRAHIPELLDVRGDQGGRALLHKHRGQVAAIDIDGRVLADIDTPSDLSALAG